MIKTECKEYWVIGKQGQFLQAFGYKFPFFGDIHGAKFFLKKKDAISWALARGIQSAFFQKVKTQIQF